VAIIVLAALILVADWATKEFAVRNLAGRRGVLRLVTAGRPLLPREESRHTLAVLWVAAAGCAVSAMLCAPALRNNVLLTAGVAAALAGAGGNLGDRLIRGAVVDFVAIGRWPAFNLADVAIVSGATLACASLVSGR
jgi:signal peptidase II